MRFSRLLSFYLMVSLLVPYNAVSEINDLTSGPSLKKFERTNVPSLEDVRSDDEQTHPSSLLKKTTELTPDEQFLVPNIKIHILGDVKAPGFYTIAVSERLSNTIALANPKRSTQRIIEIRHPDQKTEQYDLYRYYYFGDLSQNPYLNNNDVLFLPSHKGSIRIEGPITRPGIYELYHEKNMEDLIKLSGGLTTAASTVHPIKVIRFSEGGKKFILDVANTKQDRKNFKINKGDIIIVPDIINDPKNFDYKVETIPGEQHFYPTATPNVFVVGNVIQPGAYPYKSHLQVKDYVAYAGPNVDASLKNVTLTREGKQKRLKFNDTLNAGDIIMVRGRPNYTKTVTIVSTALSVVLTALLLEQTVRNR